MYALDTNINTAFERQADRVHAVQAYGTGQAAAGWTGNKSQTNRVAVQATLVLAAAAPIVLLAWGMMAR